MGEINKQPKDIQITYKIAHDLLAAYSFTARSSTRKRPENEKKPVSNIRNVVYKSQACAALLSYFAALFITALNLSTGQKPFASTGQPFSSSVTRCAGDCSDSTLALRSCSELW